MPTIIETKAFTFDELSDDAKERARDWYRESRYSDSSDFDHVIDDFATICDIIGIELRTHEVKLMSGKTRRDLNVLYSIGYCQSDYASFEGTYDYKATAPAKIREYAPQDEELHRIADELTEIQVRNAFGLRAEITNRGSRGYASIEVHDRRNECRDLGDAKHEVVSLIHDLERWLYRQLRNQSDYIYSDEAVDDSITANEYMFDEEGNRHVYA